MRELANTCTNEICSDVGHFYSQPFHTFGSLWKKIKIAKVSMHVGFFSRSLARSLSLSQFACHSDLIKMEESNKMTDDGYSCTACDHSTGHAQHTNTSAAHKTRIRKRHENYNNWHFSVNTFYWHRVHWSASSKKMSWMAIKATASICTTRN